MLPLLAVCGLDLGDAAAVPDGCHPCPRLADELVAVPPRGRVPRVHEAAGGQVAAVRVSHCGGMPGRAVCSVSPATPVASAVERGPGQVRRLSHEGWRVAWVLRGTLTEFPVTRTKANQKRMRTRAQPALERERGEGGFCCQKLWPFQRQPPSYRVPGRCRRRLGYRDALFRADGDDGGADDEVAWLSSSLGQSDLPEPMLALVRQRDLDAARGANPVPLQELTRRVSCQSHAHLCTPPPPSPCPASCEWLTCDSAAIVARLLSCVSGTWRRSCWTLPWCTPWWSQRRQA